MKITAVVKRGHVDRALAAGLTVDRIRDGEGAAGQGVATQGAGKNLYTTEGVRLTVQDDPWRRPRR